VEFNTVWGATYFLMVGMGKASGSFWMDCCDSSIIAWREESMGGWAFELIDPEGFI